MDYFDVKFVLQEMLQIIYYFK